MSQIFISYARKDHFFVDRLREDLERANIKYWIDHEGLSPGTSSWELAIREALKICESVLWVVSPASFASAYVRDEISIARMYERKIYPIFADGENWLECVPLGTGEIQYIDARSDYNTARDKILETLGVSDSTFIVPDEPKPSLPEGQEPRNPYKGLVAFTEKDTDDFFGRETLVKKLEERITARLHNEKDRFLAVLGPSGAGKSSVVMAGVIPTLKKNQANWTFLPKIVPGIHPVESLADALYSVMSEKRLSDIEADLNSRGGRMLHRLSRQLEAEQVVLYIDQFEEVFTLTNSEDERQQFIDLIVQAATEPDGKMLILLSMRADFYGHPMNYPHLGALVEANNVGVLPMSISELHEAIEKPARLPDVALTFDSGLVAEIVFALRERDKALAGALPLLQFTLERLFAERDGTHLNFAAYQAMGGVQGAIGTHCEAVFSKLPETAQEKLGQVFLPLVNIDENTGEATRRRGELETVIADTDAKALVDTLIKNRILQTGREGKLVYLEIAHESLFRSWERLVGWIKEAQEDLILLRQAILAAEQWFEAGKPEAELWKHERLQLVYTALENLALTFPKEYDEFIIPEAERLYDQFVSTVIYHHRLSIIEQWTRIGEAAFYTMIRALLHARDISVDAKHQTEQFQTPYKKFPTPRSKPERSFQMSYSQTRNVMPINEVEPIVYGLSLNIPSAMYQFLKFTVNSDELSDDEFKQITSAVGELKQDYFGKLTEKQKLEITIQFIEVLEGKSFKIVSPLTQIIMAINYKQIPFNILCKYLQQTDIAMKYGILDLYRNPMPIGLGHWDEDEADEEEELPDNISQFIQLVFAELNNTSPDIVRKALQLLYDSRKLLGEKQFISAGALRGKLLDLVENGEATLAFISIDFLSYFVDEYPHIVSEIPHVIFKQRLREFLGDVDEDIIRRTIQELTKIAHHNPQEFAPLVSQVLERSQPMHYSVLILALNFVETIILANVVVDAESLFDVLHSLPDEDSEIRLHLTKIYMGLYFDDDRVIQVLRNYLQDNRHSRTPSNPYDSMKISASRFKAAEALARQDIDAGYDYLLDHLLNGSVGGWGLPGSKQSALHILANLGTERARLLLEEHTDYYKDDESN